MLQTADPETRLYVLVNQYRECGNDVDRRSLARLIHAELRGQSARGDLFDSSSALLGRAMAARDVPLSPSLLDPLAATIFQRKRTSSLMDLTKTVFMDLVTRGFELRSMTYDSELLVTFASLVNNYDSAAWESFPCSVKRAIDNRKVKVPAWQFKLTSFEQHCFTGKTKLTIDVPAYVALALVSRPENKLKWEKQLVHCELIKQFGPDFSVLYSRFQTPALIMDRDAVLGYLTGRHDGHLVCVARSVPFGQIATPAGHLRIDVDISGYQIRSLSDSSCEVTMMLQLREIRKTNHVVFNAVRRKRMASLFRLKVCCDSFIRIKNRTAHYSLFPFRSMLNPFPLPNFAPF